MVLRLAQLMLLDDEEKVNIPFNAVYFFCKINTTADAFSALTALVWHWEEHPACKKLSDEVLALLSVWSEVVQMICIWSS